MDLWGNVKIPDISRLTSDTDSAEWVEVTNSSDVQYSSILGIPLRDIPEEGNTTFFAETSYISLNCEGLSEITSDTDLNVTTLEGLKVPTTGIKPNGTYYGISVETDSWAMALNGFLGGGPYGTIIGLENSTTEYAPFTLRFDSPLGNVTIHCPLTTTYIESHVQCYDQSCAVTSLRPSQLHHPSRNLTNLGYYGAFLEFTLYLTNATMTGLHSGTESALELFLADPDLTTQAGLAWPTISNVSLSDFELRLQQIINAFWFGSYDPTSVMGGNLNMTGASMVFDTVPGSHSQFKRIYHCNITWLTLAIVSASVMLLAAAFVGVLGFVTRGPQVLGYVSGALRDNPYIIPGLKTEKGNGYYDVNHAETVSGSEGGGRALKFSNTIPTPSRISAPMKVNSTIGGMSRSRKLQNLQIRLQDVDPNSEVGHIAISRCGDGLGDGICDNGGNQGDLNSRDRKSDVGQLKAGRLYH
ncbi:putative phospho-2-dehydro-3-deoxyheptonate aldolase [Phaeomoniella chlamydospora]|uniref:Putative phospho-2-dehydro-3-deoxyheptonate aldolase n=1 Tax=Phaeomoniella chlamydospora TaxID=158046 RepID=A0A0G2EL17_PHACM|nr:putative phospho-2-dehydro-3-deoxyheptonate aldolase [Phaeomoniella chlamydospora]